MTGPTGRSQGEHLPRRLSRRTALASMMAVGGAAVGTGAFAGCSGPSGPSGGSDEPVRVWMVPGSPTDQKFQQEQFKQLEKKTPGLKVEVQFFPTDQFANAMQLAFTGGQAVPDVFKSHGAQQLNLTEVHRREWVAPLDEYIDDKFKERFPQYVYEPGSAVYIDGKPWGVPHPDPAAYSTRVQLSNMAVLNKYGFDAPPTTWTELREMAAKINRDANREAYGTAVSGAAPGPCLAIIQNLAGPQPYRQDGQPPVSLLTGHPAMAEQSEVAMVSFFQQLHADKILAPGWQSWKGDTLLQQLAAGRLGTYTYPIFHVEAARKTNPDIDLAVTMPVVPDEGQKGTRNNQDILATWMMSSKAKQDKAWKVLDFIGSLEYERAAFQQTGLIGIMPQIYEGIEVDPDTKAIREVAAKVVRTHPRPEAKNQGAEAVYNDIVAKGPKPGVFALWMQAITRGTDFKGLAEKYDTDLNKVMQEQFDQATGKGMDVSFDTYTFPDWDVMTDYVTQ